MVNSQSNLVLNQRNESVEILIHEIRGKQVILDKDLAKLYDVTTGNLNKAVKRNLDRFPERYMFQLTHIEYEHLIFQIGISNGRGGTRHLPYAFTEQGVAMLSGILHSEIATEVSIRIMDAFVAMRHYLVDNDIPKSLNNINNKLIEHDEKLDFLFSKLS